MRLDQAMKRDDFKKNMTSLVIPIAIFRYLSAMTAELQP